MNYYIELEDIITSTINGQHKQAAMQLKNLIDLRPADDAAYHNQLGFDLLTLLVDDYGQETGEALATVSRIFTRTRVPFCLL